MTGGIANPCRALVEDRLRNANAIESNAAVQASVAMAKAKAKTFGFRPIGGHGRHSGSSAPSIGPRGEIACEAIHNSKEGFLCRNKRFGRNARVPIKTFF